MKKIILSEEQVEVLLARETVFISEDESIEILDNELILNKNGRISNMLSLNIEFSEEIICNHFNIRPVNVICHELSSEDWVFRLRISPGKELVIVVCPVMTAIRNTDGFLSEKNAKKYCDKSKIGIYHRLGNSSYYIRWDEEFI